ncbi:MAG: hypothetical protein WD512_03100, partial [Candidatus Paceibacterota bacterium]
MKKLYLLLIMLGLFALPGITTQAALTPPSLFDYSFAYNATDGEFQFSDGVDTYTPEFTRTADGIHFNYVYIGDGDGLLPFEITLIFNRSNTLWSLGTTGYIATDTKIGSDNTVGTTFNKASAFFNNTTSNDFYVYLDYVSVGAGINMLITDKYNNIYFSNQSNERYNHPSQNQLLKTFIPSNNNISFFSSSVPSALQRYIDAFYLQNSNTSPAFIAGQESTTSYQNGFTAGFGEGYLTGVMEDNAYALGYARGLLEGSDMETGSSLFILIVGAIGFIMMIFGFTTKRGIFNLLSVAAFVVLGGVLAEYVAF